MDCNPDIETCGNNSSLSEVEVRPSGADLFHLTFSVFGLEFISPVLITFVSLAIFPEYAFTALNFLVSTYLFAQVYWVPLLLSLLYFIFGDNFFLFNWVDTVLVFLIEYAISNLTPLIFLLGAIVPVLVFLSTPEWRGLTTTYLLLYTCHAYFLQVQTMKLSVGAIRHLDPAWEREPLGGYLLWPSVFYWLGIKEHSEGKRSSD